MSTIKALYGTQGQGITCTLTSLANNASRQSLVVDNTANLFLDALVSATIKTAASGVATTGSVNVYAYGTVDGSTYSDGATGSDATFTPTASGANLRLIGTFSLVAASTTYQLGPMSVANAFGGVLPEKWGIIITNTTGAAFDATTASLEYQGVQAQSV